MWGWREETQEGRLPAPGRTVMGPTGGKRALRATLEAESPGTSRAPAGRSWGCRRRGSRVSVLPRWADGGAFY